MSTKQFIVDEEGKKVGVLLDIEEYERVLAELEELESIRAFDQAVREIEQELC